MDDGVGWIGLRERVWVVLVLVLNSFVRPLVALFRPFSDLRFLP